MKMSSQMAEKQAKEEVSDKLTTLRHVLDRFRANLLDQVTAETDPILPKVAFKLLVYREALFWRTVELLEGAIDDLENGRILSGLLLARSVQECVAANHYLRLKLEDAITADSARDLDDSAMKLLLGARWDDHNFQAVNIVTMIDKADKTIPQFRQVYDDLSEYAHPNYSGVAMMFTRTIETSGVALCRYARGENRHSLQALTALIGSLMLFEHDYNDTADKMPLIVKLCARDLETKART